MLAVDLIAGAVIAGAVLLGTRQGFAAALPIAAFGAGAVLGTRAPLVLGEDLSSSSALLIALPAALLLGALAAALAERLGGRFERPARAPARRGRAPAAASAIAGGLLVGSVGVVLVWMVAPALTELNSLRDPVKDSSVVAELNSVLKPAGPAPEEGDVPAEQVPGFAFGRPDVAAPDPRTRRQRNIRRAVRGVVKIGVSPCGASGRGTGWLAADGIVVTNAHVVRRTRKVIVRRRGTGRRHEGTAIWFSRRNDLALLRVPGLRGAPTLPIVRRPRAGTPGAIIGFPTSRVRINAARLGPTSSRFEGKLDSMLAGFPRRTYGRLVTTFRGKARPGNSGGPVVDRRGRVLATVSAGSNVGQIAVPNRLVRDALRRAGPKVSTGPCPPDL